MSHRDAPLHDAMQQPGKQAERAGRPLRVVVYSMNYAPEPVGIGKYTGELVDALIEAGVQVAVVTAQPYYPAWRRFDAYANRYRVERPRAGLTVYRCPLYVPADPTGARRLLHHLSFAVATLPVLARLAVWRPRVIWMVAPSLMSAPVAWTVARLSRAKCWLHVQDFEVDAALNLGIVKSAWLSRLALGIEGWLLRHFDVVSSISSKMLARAHAKGADSQRLVSLPNWIDVAPRTSMDSVRDYRRSLHLSAGDKVCLYSGSMGRKQGFEVLADAARLLAHRSDIKFVFCGEGAGRSAFIEYCEGLRNVTFVPLQPADCVPALLASADVHLLPQRADVADLVMPSKLAGMLASGKPVVATAGAGSEVAAIVAGCGIVSPPGDAAALARAVETLVDAPELAARLGSAGRRYALDHLDRARVLGAFVATLAALDAGSAASGAHSMD
jgi:colanic acid biosynthesis glycosyl transferase WcaI